MAFRATLNVLLSCNWSQATKLLAAAEKGSPSEVLEILGSKPQLAAYTGFNNSYSPLHRAAAAGHLEVCRCIIEPIKQRIKAAEGTVSTGRKRQTTKKWQGLLTTVLNQRTSRSMTPLMLACENGHATVAAYLLREGADPLACDWVHMRTCLHYAAMAGQVDCLRLLCSINTQVAGKDGFRALRDVVVQDIQVETCRFIDQRAFGGLTALHFAVVTGNLEAVQALLRGGASIMVKTDGEAYIGDEYLVPGSTPLHIAVIIGNISIVHAILQAHMENMNVVGQGLDERGRRPWEGSSRTDIRSVRNTFRKLAFHLARERGMQQLMSLVDPRIPIDVALDAARDTEHGIGPKRLSTIVALVLQQSLLQWLDKCQDELEKEASSRTASRPTSSSALPVESPQLAAPAPTPAAAPAAATPAAVLASPAAAQQQQQLLQPGLPGRPPLPPGSRRPSSEMEPGAGAGLLHDSGGGAPLARTSADKSASCEHAGTASADGMSSPKTPTAAGQGPEELIAAVPAAEAAESLPAADVAAAVTEAAGAAPPSEATPAASPFAAPLAAAIDTACPYGSQSAPVTPAMPQLDIERQASAPQHRMQLAASMPGLLQLGQEGTQGSRAPALGDSGQGPSSPTSMQRMDSLHAYMGMLSVKRARTRSIDVSSTATRDANPSRSTRGNAAAPRLHRQLSSPANISSPRGGSGGVAPADGAPLSARGRNATDSMLEAGEQPDRTVTVMRRRSNQASTPSVRGLLTSIRERLRSADSLPAPNGQAAELEGKDKDLCGETEPDSPQKSEATEGDVECGVCLDHVVEVAFAGCEHSLCLECARNLTKQDKKPPHCPFCRRLVVGFTRVSPTKHSFR